MEPHAVRLAASLAALLLAGACGPAQEAAQESARPNVLLVSIDSARRDLFSAYGRVPKHAPEQSTSPNIDRLASEGVLFENASATSSWTLPSHVSLLTGRPELAHAVEADRTALSESVPLLAETLSGAGYTCVGIHSGPYLGAEYGFGRGFARYHGVFGSEVQAALDELEHLDPANVDMVPPSWSWAAAGRRLEAASHRDRSADRVTDQALLELQSLASDGAPFFLFLHYFDPHYDYVPPAPFDRRFDPDYAGEIDGRDFINDPRIALFDEDLGTRPRVIGERDLEHLLALYEGELASTDQELGRLLDRLDDLGLGASTVVVVVSDHGDEFFEHEGLGHRRTLHEEVLAVPLVMRYPGVLPAGRRVQGSVSIAHVHPTLLSLVGIENPPELAERSLLPPATGSDASLPAMARLVTWRSTEEPLGRGARHRSVACIETDIRESLRLGAIKVRRLRTRIHTQVELPAAQLEELAAHDRALARQSVLEWIDLERHPDEHPADWSTDFSDPRAARALEAFRSEYALWAPMRSVAESFEGSHGTLLQLRGLGYVEAYSPPRENELLRLPPP